jgi:hypothetical protein
MDSTPMIYASESVDSKVFWLLNVNDKGVVILINSLLPRPVITNYG